MLTWSRRADGLYANGYVIRLVAPFEWALSELSADDGSGVRLIDEPLATSQTLAEAKREAELLHAAYERRELRRRWLTTFLLAGGSIVFTAGLGAPWGFLVTFLLSLVAVRSLARIIGMVLAPYISQYDDLIYQ